MPCANDRARHVANAVSEFAKDRELRLITLTLRKTDRTLKEDIDRLYRSFSKLRRKKGWSETQSGGVYFCEIKRRRGDDGWHTHLHALSEGVWLDKKWLSKTWHEITGDSFVVDIRACKSAKDAARYVAKYASKGIHGTCYYDRELLKGAIMAIKGRRLVSKFGTWSELDLKADEAIGDWLPIDSLERLLHRRIDGDESAKRILDLLRSSPCQATERSPPPDPGPSLFD